MPHAALHSERRPAIAPDSFEQNQPFPIVGGALRPSTDRVSSEPVCVNACGYSYFCDNQKRITVSRPHGRSDYQLIYIQKGQGDFTFNGKTVLLKKGTLIRYAPGEAQEYSYHSSCPTLAYWVHFSGTSIETLLRRNGLWEDAVYELRDNPTIAGAFTKLIGEMHFKSYNYLLLSCAYLVELIVRLSRSRLCRTPQGEPRHEALFPAITLMHREYYVSRTTEEYARLCGMSGYHFIRRFKECTGLPPHLYLTRIRLEKAKLLLLTTHLSVSEIAFSTGYDDPFYFSRLFKKYVGASPSDFKARP